MFLIYILIIEINVFILISFVCEIEKKKKLQYVFHNHSALYNQLIVDCRVNRRPTTIQTLQNIFDFHLISSYIKHINKSARKFHNFLHIFSP